jgi:aminopeptidase N
MDPEAVAHFADNYGQEKEIDYFLRYCASGFASEQHYRDYSEFFSLANIYGSERAFEQGKETILWQNAWRERDNQLIGNWLKQF